MTSAEQPSAGTLVDAVLDGRYRIEHLLGEGGMGAVYLATDLRLEKRVAVKVMAPELAANPDALARFHREARVTSGLGHPHIVQVFDFSTTPSGAPFLVMEYLEGEDLDGRLRRTVRLPAETTARIVRQVASALAATHTKSVVHRDLKPGNIFLLEVAGETDFVKVLDFGISKVRTASTKLTRTASIIGTPNYMSPEQAKGRVEDIDERTDQWALACIAWECLSGEGPFVAENVPSILFHIVHEPPAPLLPKVSGLRPAVEDVLRRALAKNKAERFPSVTDFAAALDAAVLASPVAAQGSARASRPADTAMSSPPGKGSVPETTFTQTAGELDDTFDAPRSRKWVWAAGTGLAFVLLLGGFLLFRPSPARKPVVASPPPASLPAAATLAPPLPPTVPTAAALAPPPPPTVPAAGLAKPEPAPEARSALAEPAFATKPKKPRRAAAAAREVTRRSTPPQTQPIQTAPTPKKEAEDKWRLD